MSPMTCRAGESWLIRHAEGGRLWEFDAPVLRTGAEHISLGRTSRPRFVNRRRFPRVPTVRPAHVAGFPLWRAAADEAAPRFVEGRLVEMGGPGLRVEAPLEARPGQRVLLAMEMGDGGFVEGVGKVHRVSHPDAASDPVFVVELVGLTEDEIASLSKQTNAMERSAISDQQSAVSDQAAPDSQEQAPKSQELTAES